VVPLEDAGELRIFAATKAARRLDERLGRACILEAISVKTGEPVRFRARCSVLAANAIQSAALLRRSQDTLRHGTPHGRNLIRRGLCFKLSEYVVGYSEDPGPDLASDDPWLVRGLLALPPRQFSVPPTEDSHEKAATG
jgi:hypothetical protein